MVKKVTDGLGFVYGHTLKSGFLRVFTSNAPITINEEFQKLTEHYGPNLRGRCVTLKEGENLQDLLEKLFDSEQFKKNRIGTTNLFEVSVTNGASALRTVTGHNKCNKLGETNDDEEDAVDAVDAVVVDDYVDVSRTAAGPAHAAPKKTKTTVANIEHVNEPVDEPAPVKKGTKKAVAADSGETPVVAKPKKAPVAKK